MANSFNDEMIVSRRTRRQKPSKAQPSKAHPKLPRAKTAVPVTAITLLCVVMIGYGTLIAPGLSYSDFHREAMAEIGFSGMLFYWLYANRHRQHASITLSTTRVFLCALFALSGLSILWATNVEFFLHKYLLWFATAMAVFLTMTLQINSKTMLNLARGLALVAGYIAVAGLIQAIFSLDLFIQSRPPSANFNNKNTAMQVMVLILPMIIFVCMFDRNKYVAKFSYLILALVLAYVFYTKTRSAWLAVTLELIILIIGLIWYRKLFMSAAKEHKINWSTGHKLAAAVGLVVFLLLINVPVPGGGLADIVSDRIGSIQDDIASYDSETRGRKALRYQIWDAALLMVRANPFLGTGMGSFFYNLLDGSENYTVYAHSRVHNDLLETVVELGVVGLVLLLGALIGLFVGLYRIITRGEPTQRVFYLLIASALAGSAINMQFSFPYQMIVPLILFGIYAGLIIKGSDIERDADAAKPKTITLSLKKRHWYAGMGVIGIIFVLLIPLNLAWLQMMAVTNNSLNSFTWKKPFRDPTLMCHKSALTIWLHLSGLYLSTDHIKSGLRLVETIEQCLPEAWFTQHKLARLLLELKRYDEAIAMMEKAKKHAPVGIYKDHINQLLAYTETKDAAGQMKIYKELTNEPIELLIKERITLRTVILLGLNLGDTEGARKYYEAYKKYRSNDTEFLSEVAPFFR